MIPGPLVLELRALGRVREREPLSRHTTVGIGGPADLFIKVETVDALVRALDAARRHRTPWFILGAGSNLLVGDAGIRGVVIEYDAKAIHGPAMQPAGRARFTIEAGASFATVARRLSRQGYAGLEWAIGIPGTLGGAVVTNAGAYGGSLSDTLVSVCVAEPGEEPRALPAADFQLAYRESVFTRGLVKDVAVLSVTLDLSPDDAAAVMARVDTLDADRKAAQPAGQNTGSVFKNPAGQSAWQLIDDAGLRGRRVGGAQITHKHCNFFANVGGATAADFKALIDLSRQTVRQRLGVEMETEVWLVGEGFDDEAATPSPGPSPAARGRGASSECFSQPGPSGDLQLPRYGKTGAGEAPRPRAAGEGPGEGVAP